MLQTVTGTRKERVHPLTKCLPPKSKTGRQATCPFISNRLQRQSVSLSVCTEIFTNIPQLEAGVDADVVDEVQASWRTFNEGVAAYVEVVYTSFPWGAREAEG